MIKILNLYAGIGGNRRLWSDKEIEVTAVEQNENIAKIYQDFFPNDKMIVGDAHQYLLDYYKEYDFIWSSPPCPTHSNIRRCGVYKGQNKAVYPDMRLYEEIIFLSNFGRALFCIENVFSYYEPLIKPQEIGRHYFWSNFFITKFKFKSNIIISETMESLQKNTGFDISKYKNIGRRDKILRNCVDSKLGLHIFNCAFKNIQMDLLND